MSEVQTLNRLHFGYLEEGKSNKMTRKGPFPIFSKTHDKKKRKNCLIRTNSFRFYYFPNMCSNFDLNTQIDRITRFQKPYV